jgi:hypothetical protein
MGLSDLAIRGPASRADLAAVALRTLMQSSLKTPELNPGFVLDREGIQTIPLLVSAEVGPWIKECRPKQSKASVRRGNHHGSD